MLYHCFSLLACSVAPARVQSAVLYYSVVWLYEGVHSGVVSRGADKGKGVAEREGGRRIAETAAATLAHLLTLHFVLYTVHFTGASEAPHHGRGTAHRDCGV